MVRNSVSVDPQFFNEVREAYLKKGLRSYQQLGDKVEIGKTTVAKYFQGVRINTENFQILSEYLGLDWQKISGISRLSLNEDICTNLPSLPNFQDDLQKFRCQVKDYIQAQCGLVRILQMSHDVDLVSIYTKVVVLDKITGRGLIGIDSLRRHVNPLEDFNRLGMDRTSNPRMEGLNIVQSNKNLMIWGKPGAGKTTFLKYLALQCVSGKIFNELIPLFVEIEKYAEYCFQMDFKEFLFDNYAFVGFSSDLFEELLQSGKFFILLDGLDEMSEEVSDRVITRINEFFELFPSNKFILSCRLSGQEYHPKDFLEIEVADFDESQIIEFVEKWFFAIDRSHKAKKMVEHLNKDIALKELANSPLLLTLMCLVFDEEGELSQTGFDIYRNAIDILLSKWDTTREKERRKIYKRLSPSQRRKLLSYVAYETFKEGEYFFPIDKLNFLISKYICNLPGFGVAIDTHMMLEEHGSDIGRRTDANDIVNSIESQHGLLVQRANKVYSFSHMAIQEYFVARKIASSPSSPDELNEMLEHLRDRLFDRRWREVFLRVAERLEDGEYFISVLRRYCNSKFSQNYAFLEFLASVSREAEKFSRYGYDISSVRAFLYDIDIAIDVDRKIGHLLDFRTTCIFTCASFLARALGKDLGEMIDVAHQYQDRIDEIAGIKCNDKDVIIALERVLAIEILEDNFHGEVNSEVKKGLDKLKELIPDNGSFVDASHLAWWHKNARHWSDNVRILLVSSHRLRDHDWLDFAEKEKSLLKRYYYANLLILECAQRSSLNPRLRQDIESSLLRPMFS